MKSIVNKFIVLILIFVIAIGGFLFFNRDRSEKVKVIMGNPSLPTISILASAGENQDNILEVNQLYGYTTAMENQYMRDSITPISSSRNFKVKVNNYDNVVMSAWFELRSLDCQRLIEKTEILPENIVAKDNFTEVNVSLDNMIEKDVEYNFVLCLNTDRHEEVYFYTRVIELSENYLGTEMDFIKKFSQATFDDGETLNLVSYIEPDPNEDNGNLGHVSIKSNYKQITWGSLNPEKVSTPIIKIKEILGDVGAFEIDYMVRALNDYDVYQYYNVREFYRIKWTSTDIYLLSYDRTMNQIFEANNQNVSTMRINLGISEDEECEYMASESTKFIAFVKENGLWMMDIKNNQTKALFSFQDVEDTDIRDAHKENDISVVSVDDKGNVEFLVYGYMNRGEHEGMVGVSLYSYDSNKNVVKEKIFIPFAREYGVLKETVGKLTYVNKDNVVFLMLSNSIYSIDLTGNEYVEIVSGLADGKYVVNNDSSVIAWESENNDKGSPILKVLNFDTGVEQEIIAEEGTRLKVIGFMNDDFCYGIAKESDIVSLASGNVTAAMNNIRIMNEKGETVKEYNKEGYYFVSANVEENMIDLERVRRSEDGVNFVKADNYQIFGNEEIDYTAVSLGVITTDRKQKEVVINFVTKVTTSKQFKNVFPKQIIFTDTNSLGIRELIDEEKNYYVYAEGELCMITENVSDAVNEAYKKSGVVIAETGDYIWAKRSKPTQFTINGISGTVSLEDANSRLISCVNAILKYNGVNEDVRLQIESGKKAVDILKEHFGETKNVLDFKGCNLDEMLYYVNLGYPVLTQTGNGQYVLIVGYDFYNVVMFNPVTGENYKEGQEEASVIYNNAGSSFLVVCD